MAADPDYLDLAAVIFTDFCHRHRRFGQVESSPPYENHDQLTVSGLFDGQLLPAVRPLSRDEPDCLRKTLEKNREKSSEWLI